MQWQPIETAPKDDWSRVMLTDGDYVREGFLVPIDYGEDEEVHAWYCLDDGREQYEFVPTHWMPLPAPPVKYPPGTITSITMISRGTMEPIVTFEVTKCLM